MLSHPTNDFAFKKTFGTPSNKPALISLLNAILDLTPPIINVTIENPFNLQDFAEDKLSVVDVKAIDRSGAIYDVEMQLTTYKGLVQRIVYYGCKLYSGQLVQGNDYRSLNPVYSILLVDGILWLDSSKLHHAFRLMDKDCGRLMDRTLEIHTLELAQTTLKRPICQQPVFSTAGCTGYCTPTNTNPKRS